MIDGVADYSIANSVVNSIINNKNVLNGKRPKWLIVVLIILIVVIVYNIIISPLIMIIIDSIESYSNESFSIEKDNWKFGKHNYFVDSKETFNGTLETLKANDNQQYMVQSGLPNKETAANMMASLNSTVLTFIEQLNREYPTDERAIRLKYKYNSKNFGEGTPLNSNNETSYSMDKGRELVVCLRDKRNPSRFHDKNTVMFVLIHELAHIASKTYGHNIEFGINFKWLLRNAIKQGHYRFIDYKLQPVTYCGIEITDTPL